MRGFRRFSVLPAGTTALAEERRAKREFAREMGPVSRRAQQMERAVLRGVSSPVMRIRRPTWELG